MLDPGLPWVIWYPLRRNKLFETLSAEEQRSVLGEHGKLGFKFGDAGYGKDIRLACHGLDKNDNDFVIGVLGKELYPLSDPHSIDAEDKADFDVPRKPGAFFHRKGALAEESIALRRSDRSDSSFAIGLGSGLPLVLKWIDVQRVIL